MHLDWVVKLGYLEHDPNSRVYFDFPVSTRKILAKETATHLLKEQTDPNILVSPNHIHVTMEILGQGFGLPMEESATMDDVTEVYRRWILVKTKRPAAFDQEEQIFYRKIFSHLSLVFEPRTSALEVQVGLCSRVLAFIEQAGREAGSRFDAQTWEHILKLMMAAADVLLKDEKDDPSQLSTKLCPLLLKVLFQMWFRSGLMQDNLWKFLGTLALGWRHRMPTIMQWNAVCLGLTNRVIRILYGNNEGTEQLFVTEFDQTRTAYDLDNKYVYYAWYRTLHLLGDLETINLPNNYLEALRGVNAVADTLLSVGAPILSKAVATPAPANQSATASQAQIASAIAQANQATAAPLSAKAPDGNTILHILGCFLFDAINIHDQPASFDRGKAQAFVTISKIFAMKSRSTDFHSNYLALFYRGIEASLKKNNYMMGVVLNNSLNLFQSEFKGVRMLIPSILAAMEAVLASGKPLEGISSKIQVLRNSCIKILSSLISLPNQFGTLKFRELDNVSEPNHITTYNEIRTKLNVILLEGLKTEEDSANRHLLLWTASAYLYENIDAAEVKEFPHSIITFLLSKLAVNAWNAEDTQHTLGTISDISSLLSYIQNYNKDTAPFVVSALCKYIENCMVEKKNIEPNENIIAKSLTCVLDWIMNDTRHQWILNNPACLKSVFEIIEICMFGQQFSDKKKVLTQGKVEEKRTDGPKKQYSQPTDKIREFANFVFVNLLYHIDNFPNPLGPASISCLINEKDYLESNGLTGGHLKCYIYNNHTLLSVIRKPRQAGQAPECLLLLRDESGRYAWNVELLYFADHNIVNGGYIEPASEDKIRPDDAPLSQEEPDEGLLSTLETFLNPTDQAVHQKLLKYCEQVQTAEAKVLAARHYGRNLDVSTHRPEQPAVNDQLDHAPSRLLMNHLGLSSLENFENLGALQKFNDPNKFNYLQNFNVLDKNRERETYTVGVIYVKKGQDDLEIFENQSGNAEYTKFLQNLGWMVNLAEHNGFQGGLDSKVTGQYAPYFATYDYEMIFQVSTLMPNKESSTKQNHKTRLINNNKILISWVEDLDSYKPPAENPYNYNIVIAQLPSKLFLCKVFVREDNLANSLLHTGPVLDNTVFSQHSLSAAVRSTVVNISRVLKEDRTKPITIRKYLLEDFTQRNKVDLPLNQYYASQFVN